MIIKAKMMNNIDESIKYPESVIKSLYFMIIKAKIMNI